MQPQSAPVNYNPYGWKFYIFQPLPEGGTFMKRIITIIVVIAMAMLSIAFGQTRKPKGRDGEARQGTRLPRGVIIRGKEVVLQKGYRFVQNPDHTVSVQRMAGGGIEGSFACTCIAKNPGTCELRQNPKALRCVEGTCTDCALSTQTGGGSWRQVYVQ